MSVMKVVGTNTIFDCCGLSRQCGVDVVAYNRIPQNLSVCVDAYRVRSGIIEIFVHA